MKLVPADPTETVTAVGLVGAAPVTIGEAVSFAHPAAASPRRILVVDDDVAVRAMLSRLLEAEEWVVTEAESAETAVEQFDRVPPDLVLTDDHLPLASAIELARTLRQRGEGVPIVIFTGRSRPELMHAAAELGIRVVSKPGVAELLDEVRVLARRLQR